MRNLWNKKKKDQNFNAEKTVKKYRYLSKIYREIQSFWDVGKP